MEEEIKILDQRKRSLEQKEKEAARLLENEKQISMNLRAKNKHLSNKKSDIKGKIRAEDRDKEESESVIFRLEEEKTQLEGQIKLKEESNSQILNLIKEIGKKI